jgi:hypothetical protein
MEFSSSNHLFFTALRPVCMQGSMILLVWLLVMIAGARQVRRRDSRPPLAGLS